MVFIAFLASILALAMGAWLYRVVQMAPTSTERANEIALAISAGASAFLSRQYRTVAMVGLPIMLLIGLALGWWYAGGFLLGADRHMAIDRDYGQDQSSNQLGFHR